MWLTFSLWFLYMQWPSQSGNEHAFSQRREGKVALNIQESLRKNSQRSYSNAIFTSNRWFPIRVNETKPFLWFLQHRLLQCTRVLRGKGLQFYLSKENYPFKKHDWRPGSILTTVQSVNVFQYLQKHLEKRAQEKNPLWRKKFFAWVRNLQNIKGALFPHVMGTVKKEKPYSFINQQLFILLKWW